MYKMKWTTGVFAKIFIRGVKFFGIVNLILGYEAVPERWQGGTHPDTLTDLMSRYLKDPEYTNHVRSEIKKVRGHLGDVGATRRVAAALEQYFQKGNPS